MPHEVFAEDICKLLKITKVATLRNVLRTRCKLQRLLALTCILGKLFDLNFILAISKKHSTHQCTFVLYEVVEYYVSYGSDMYIMLLDCSKAFDRVNYTKSELSGATLSQIKRK